MISDSVGPQVYHNQRQIMGAGAYSVRPRYPYMTHPHHWHAVGCPMRPTWSLATSYRGVQPRESCHLATHLLLQYGHVVLIALVFPQIVPVSPGQ